MCVCVCVCVCDVKIINNYFDTYIDIYIYIT